LVVGFNSRGNVIGCWLFETESLISTLTEVDAPGKGALASAGVDFGLINPPAATASMGL